jgi:hypothetical protein
MEGREMRITKKILEQKGACERGVEWFVNQKETNAKKLIEKLISEKDKNENALSDANWGIVRIMTYKQQIQYAVYAAEQVIDIYEKKYPSDRRPREAIEAAKAVIKNPSNKNKVAAWAAAKEVVAAVRAAEAAWAAEAAEAAAWAAAEAAEAAAWEAAWAARVAAEAWAAAWAARVAAAAKVEMKVKILRYGLSLLK